MEVRTQLDVVLFRQRRSNRWLAREIGVHESQVSRWRTGMHLPEPERRQQIAAALDETPAVLWPDVSTEPDAKEAA